MTHHINRRARSENMPTAIGMARGVAESLLWHSGQHSHGDTHPLVTLVVYGLAGTFFGTIITGFALLLLGVFFPLALICLVFGLLTLGVGLMCLGLLLLLGILLAVEKIRGL